MGLPLKNFTKKVFTPEEFHEISVYPLKNSTYNIGFTPKEFLSLWPLPLKNSSTFIPYP